MVLLTTGTVFLFEQSPANEAVRAFVGFRILDMYSSPLYVGLAVLLVTLCVEITTSFFISLGLKHSKHFQSFATRHKNVLESKGSVGISLMSNGVLALTVGSGVVVIKYRLQRQRATFRQGFKVGVEAAAWIAVVSGLIAYLASGGVEVVRAYGYGGVADAIVKYGSDWRFWFVLFVITQCFELGEIFFKKKR